MPLVAPQPASRETLRVLGGEVVFLYAFDIAYEMRPVTAATLLGQPIATFEVDSSKRLPRHLFFYRPQMIRMPPIEKFADRGQVRLAATVKLLPVGAISVMIRVAFHVDWLGDLVPLHDMSFSDGTSVYDIARDLAERARLELRPFLVRPTPGLSDEEAYTIFCINTPENDGFSAEAFQAQYRRDIAALLVEEPDPDALSEQEAGESSSQYLSYSKRDLIVIDWDAALLVDEPRHFDQLLYTIELANVQLTELEAYDRLLDDVTERAYRDVSAGRSRGSRRIHRELREIRVDLSRLTDELGNISKFFGDWHAARVYQTLASRFHLADWHRTIDHKMETLDHIYSLLSTERNNRTMILLEAAIVALFVFEIVKSILGR